MWCSSHLRHESSARGLKRWSCKRDLFVSRSEGSIVLTELHEGSAVYLTYFCIRLLQVEGSQARIIFEGTVSINYSFAGIKNGEQIFRHPVAVERINTLRLKSTCTNTHGSCFTRSKPSETRCAISSDVTSCGFVFEITLETLLPKHLLKGYKVWV
jgi:hypothetical protein